MLLLELGGRICLFFMKWEGLFENGVVLGLEEENWDWEGFLQIEIRSLWRTRDISQNFEKVG